MTSDEINILNYVEGYRSTLESIMFSQSSNEDFDPFNRETWSHFYRGVDAAFEDILSSVKSAIEDNDKKRPKTIEVYEIKV